MTLVVRFHEEASAELAAAVLYYESQAPGLGERFLREVEAATQIAAEFPAMGSPFRFGTRRVFPRKFPFSVVYRMTADQVIVLAVAADAQKPGYWRTRRRDA